MTTHTYHNKNDAGIAFLVRYVLVHKRLPVRERYFKRSDGRLRVRYKLAGYTSMSATLSFTALSLFPMLSLPLQGGGIIAASNGWDRLGHPVLVAAAPATYSALPTTPIESAPAVLNNYRDEQGQIRRDPDARATAALTNNTPSTESATTLPTHQQKRLTIASGDTLAGLLVKAGLTPDDAGGAIRAMKAHVGPNDLRPGQMLNLELAAADTGYQFTKLSLTLDPVRTVEVNRGWGGFMNAALIEKPLKNDMGASVAVVKASLYGAAQTAGIPTAVTAEAIKAFGHQIDFQRDIHPGDRMEVMYDRMVTDDGYVAKNGGLIFARLYADGRELSIYRFQTRDGRTEYFDRKGNSFRKALLRTPMDGGRVTSGFGMRRHPLLGYSKMHKGVDFGAPTGTPIYAAGDGVVEKAGRFGAYGNYVRLKHTASMKTAYAHMSRFGMGIRPGTRVKQGQVIGYVGTTGRSTGPHLHYEVLMGDNQVNPQSVKLPTMVALDGNDLKKFKEMVGKLDRDFKNKTQGMRYASSDEVIADTDLIR